MGKLGTKNLTFHTPQAEAFIDKRGVRIQLLRLKDHANMDTSQISTHRSHF